jgi:hypothetical protein
MRVELVYAPGCSTYKKALHVLETVIAEERLPIPVELVEHAEGGPFIRINGIEVGNSPQNHDYISDCLSASWRELTSTAV